MKRLELIRYQLEEVSQNLESNLIDLESMKEKHMLNLLIETTRAVHSDTPRSSYDYHEPDSYTDDESFTPGSNGLENKKNGDSTRMHSLKLLQIRQSKEYEAFLGELINVVQRSNTFLSDLFQSTRTLREQSEADLKNQVAEWKSNVLGYIKNMNENSEKSKGMSLCYYVTLSPFLFNSSSIPPL